MYIRENICLGPNFEGNPNSFAPSFKTCNTQTQGMSGTLFQFNLNDLSLQWDWPEWEAFCRWQGSNQLSVTLFRPPLTAIGIWCSCASILLLNETNALRPIRKITCFFMLVFEYCTLLLHQMVLHWPKVQLWTSSYYHLKLSKPLISKGSWKPLGPPK